ncbi:hypothetical protein HWV62_35015 [Athelia sp. TMB]|nr:hypothetical protein HWV62_35015 [Athelia sp. TMB]
MADEKSTGLKWPEDAKTIPAPAVASRGAAGVSSHHRRARILKYFLGSAAILFIVHTLTCRTPPHHFKHEEFKIVHSLSTHGRHKPLRGKAAEDLFLSIPDTESAIAASRHYAGKPHMAGTPGDFDTATDFLGLLQKELGIKHHSCSPPIFKAGSTESRHATLSIPQTSELKAWIDVYYPVLNTPTERSLEILGSDGKPVWTANIEEVIDETDPDAHKYANSVPAFHGLSAEGEVEGRLIYVNYGRKQDYDALVESGVDFNGSIVIARYGGLFRGLIVKGAQELGAVGALIYSDLRDDGTVTEANGYLPYPDGPARSRTSVQRGSVQFLSKFPGDPTTPGYPSYENSTRIEGTNKPSIPSLPISAATAEVLLKELEDGGQNRVVKLVNHGDTKVTPIWNVNAVIPGHIKDEVIVVGNHRDAWVLGASDPTSGTVSMHEVIRGLGVLLKNGWKPLRTILIASWDAEEYGLIGSTEWGEDFPEFIDKYVAAYLNLDSSSTGSRFSASASPSLAHIVRDTASAIAHPTDANRTLWDATQDTGAFFGAGIIEPEVLAMYEEELRATDALGVGALGSGSDYTVFLQHLGVASSQAAYSSTLHDAVYHYHSLFDSERWQEIYGDPGFLKHVAVAKQLGLQLLRMADAVVLPLNTTHYAFELENYLDKVELLAVKESLTVDLSSLRASIRALQEESAALDAEKSEAEQTLNKVIKKWQHRRSRVHRVFCRVTRFLGFEAHKCAHKKPEGAGASVDDKRRGRRHLARELIRAVKRVRAVNHKLITFERGFISKEGIPQREWYKHLGIAPGRWLGYGATPLPALTESVSLDRNATLAQYEAGRLEALIGKLKVSIQT